MATILFYSPLYRRSRDVESLMLFFKSSGHNVFSLSQSKGAEINPFLVSKGIKASSYVLPGGMNFTNLCRHIVYFVRFCIRNEVTVVFSHLDSANYVASIAQYFVRAKVFLCRHHIDEAALYNYHLSWSYRLTNKLARRIIVVSQHALCYVSEVEKVPIQKLIHINLGYDFSLFQIPDAGTINRIRQNYHSPILLVTVCRLTRFKRPELSIDVVNRLRKKGVNAHLIILGAGEMHHELQRMVDHLEVKQFVSMPGHVINPLDYMAAADYILHPSVLESSCVVIKEAGLVKRPVIVCQHIGDFDDYIKNGENGFLVDRERFVEEALDVIGKSLNNKEWLMQMGKGLNKDILKLFDIARIGRQYDPLINS